MHTDRQRFWKSDNGCEPSINKVSVYYVTQQNVSGNGEVEAMMSVASGEFKKYDAHKLEDPVDDESLDQLDQLQTRASMTGIQGKDPFLRRSAIEKDNDSLTQSHASHGAQHASKENTYAGPQSKHRTIHWRH